MTSFADLAAVKVDDIPEAIPLPAGTYVWEFIEIPEQKETRSGYGVMVNHKLRLVSPADNFEDPSALEEYIEKMGDPSGQVRTLGIYYPTGENPESSSTEPLEAQQARALRNIQRLYTQKLGLEGSTIGELQSALPGVQCYVEVTHRQLPDGGMIDSLDDRNVMPLD